MSLTTPSPATSQTRSSTSTTDLPSSIPHFTPDDGCLDSTNIWQGSRPCDIGTGFTRDTESCDYFLWDYLGGTEALPTSQLATKECYPREAHVATRCPESYSAVDSTSLADDERNGSPTTMTLLCCPEVHSFRISRSATLENQNGDMATFDVDQCVAKTLSLDGENPYTLAVSSWESDSDYTSTFTTKTATLDTDSDLLYASVVTVTYEVIPSLNATCAPNCQNPWTGGAWPVPTTDLPEVTSDPSPNDSSLGGLLPAFIGGVTAGSVVFLAIIIGVVWFIVRRKKRNKRAAQAQATQPWSQERAGENEIPQQKTGATTNVIDS